jgi:hypothetical protein
MFDPDFIKFTIASTYVLESTERVVLKFHEKRNMTHVQYFDHNSSSRNPNGVKPKEHES